MRHLIRLVKSTIKVIIIWGPKYLILPLIDVLLSGFRAQAIITGASTANNVNNNNGGVHLAFPAVTGQLECDKSTYLTSSEIHSTS